MKKQITIIIFLLSFLFQEAAIAQTRTISGTVLDSQTGARMGSVSVSAEGRASTVTNSDGGFIIKVPQDAVSLTFTCLGYKTGTANISETDGPLKIRLVPDLIPLSEIVVESPENIVEAAIRLIPENYPLEDSNLRCFYRETTRKGRRYIYVAEAVTGLYKTPYTVGVGPDYVTIEKGRRLISPKQADTLGAKIQGGPTIAVNLDIVKNSDFILSLEEMKHYSFAMEVPEEIDGRPQLVVSFKPKDIMPYPLFYGKYYIDKETLSITRCSMSMDISDPAKVRDEILVSKPIGVRFKPVGYDITADYRNVGGTTMLSYISASISFKCEWKRKLFSSPYTVTAETVVTSYGLKEKPSRRGHSFSRYDSYFDHNEYFRDDTFWGDYNIIAPTESLDKAIDRLLRRSD
jgi:hypothetical protein